MNVDVLPVVDVDVLPVVVNVDVLPVVVDVDVGVISVVAVVDVDVEPVVDRSMDPVEAVSPCAVDVTGGGGAAVVVVAAVQPSGRAPNSLPDSCGPSGDRSIPQN